MKKNEKMRKKALKQWVSLFLTGLVFTSVCPLQALAVDTGTSTVETTENADESKTLTTISSALPQTSTSSSIEETTATSGSQEENLKPQVRSESVETWMPDENLRNVVAKHLSTRTNPVKPEDITKEAMANLNMLDFDYMDIPADTVVDFTGLEYAGEILSLNTTLIVATNIPELKLGEGCFAYVRPNVLPYLRKSGTIRQLVIKGSNSNGLPSAELVGVGAYINQLAPTEMLRVFTTDMTDFSTLGITIDVPSSLFKSTNYMTTPLELPAINITEGYEGNYFYTQDILIGANGRSLISTEGLRNLRVILWDEDKTSPIPLSYFELTDEGINLNLTGIPSFIKYVEFRFETLARALTYPSYGLRAIAPIQRSTPAADVTVKYLNEKDEEVQASKTIKGKVGDDYDATTAEYKFDTIGDYELDTSKLPTNAKGKLADQAKDSLAK